MRIILYLAVISTIFLPQNTYAQLKSELLSADSGYERVVMPELFSTSILIDDNDEPPTEPNIAKVKFLRLPALNATSERVGRLIQGIKKDIPPEYDHYGHEIRRYMKGVGNIKIFEDEEYLIKQIKNVNKAQIIADYWQKHLDDEVAKISKIMEDPDSVSFAVRTAFKQNKITTVIFISSLKAWLEANRNVLMTILKDKSDSYEVYYPEIIITSAILKTELYNSLVIRQNKLIEIRDYQLFSMMVY